MEIPRLIRHIYETLERHRGALLAFCAVVIFCTTYILILPAFTLDNDEAKAQGGISVPGTEQEAAKPSLEDSSMKDSADNSSGKSTESAVRGSSGRKNPDTDRHGNVELSSECDGFTVTAASDTPAGLPEDTRIEAGKIGTDDARYDEYYRQIDEAIREESGYKERAAEIELYDISLLSGKDEVQPDEPLDVTISYDKAVKLKKNTDEDNIRIIHFARDKKGEEEPQLIDADDTAPVIEKNRLQETTFKAESFSVYAVVYTVDFHYEVNGQKYEYSIPGGGCISFEKLAEVLHIVSNVSQKVDGDEEYQGQRAVSLNEITISKDTKDFVNDVESITFSDPKLAWVGKVNSDTTIGELKEANSLECEYSDSMTKEQIAEINAQKLMAGDWVLIGLKPFSSEEILTVTMMDGEVFTIQVTDAIDTKRDGKKPGTVQGEDTASEGIKITMFDYGPDKLDQVNNTYNSTDNSGINKGHDLKFYAYGTNGSTINNFTGGAYAMQGVVRSTLDANGYPVTSTNSNGGKGESLAYLFDPNNLGTGASVKSSNANRLFQRDEDGNLWYDSDKNYAYLNGNDFVLYEDTYLEEGADYANPFRIGFFPYNDYDNRYQCIHGDNFRWGCKGQNDWTVRDQVGHYNHHFGMKVEGNFYMTEDKKTEKGKDMIFKFSGDDDMWVFVDGVLVLDIGGIHNPVDGYINFTDGTVHVDAAKTANGGSQYALGTNTTIADAFIKAGKKWDDSPLSQHDIKIFYMERGGMYSNLAITMNLPTYPLTREVELEKKDTQSSGALKDAEFTLYSDADCTREVKDKTTGETVTVKSGSDGKAKFTELLPGQTYYFKETKAPDGYRLGDDIYLIEVPDRYHESDPVKIYKYLNGEKGEEVTQILNAKDVYGEFTIVKTDATDNAKLAGAEFTLFEDKDCSKIVKKVTSNVDGEVIFSNLSAGKTYYFKETKEPPKTGNSEYTISNEVYRVVVEENG